MMYSILTSTAWQLPTRREDSITLSSTDPATPFLTLGSWDWVFQRQAAWALSYHLTVRDCFSCEPIVFRLTLQNLATCHGLLQRWQIPSALTRGPSWGISGHLTWTGREGLQMLQNCIKSRLLSSPKPSLRLPSTTLMHWESQTEPERLLPPGRLAFTRLIATSLRLII